MGEYIFKPLCVFGFLLLALQNGALETEYGLWIMAGLIACGVGDICLLSRKNVNLFKLGMAAFAVGHVFYIMAAYQIRRPDLSLTFGLGTFLMGLFVAWFAFRFFRPYLQKGMVLPVLIYISIISLMCVYAVQSNYVGAYILILPAAFAFAVSDVFVARDRFIKPNPKNALMITPLYFAAQALFALSVMA